MEQFLQVETLVITLLLVASLVALAVRRLRVPYTVALVVAGLAITFQSSLQLTLTPELILALFVPPLVFEAAFHLDLTELRRNLPQILVLAVPGVILTTLIIGGVIAWATPLSLPVALVFGALIALVACHFGMRIKPNTESLGAGTTNSVVTSITTVVLADAVVPRQAGAKLAQMFGVGYDTNGFYSEAHPKLRPVETAAAGVFLAGACQAPKDIPDTVAQASAAAARVLALISRGRVAVEAAIANINEDKCSGCRVCNLLCPYTAISYDEVKKVSRVNDVLCKGCGTCVAACPSGSISG